LHPAIQLETFGDQREMPKHILIVDGSPVVRAGLRAILSPEPDFAVCGETGTSREALQMARALQPDLAIMDLALSDGAGLDLIRRLKAQAPDTRILVCCLHDENVFAERAVRAGALGFVNKGESTEQLVAAAHRVLAGKVWVSHRIVERVVDGLAGRNEGGTSAIGGLSDRELEVFGLIGEGLSTRAIAERLHLSVKTIETHREKIKRKLGVTGSAELARRAVQWTLDPY
jgi:DNA-binding NarL/FixJ family response regulator